MTITINNITELEAIVPKMLDYAAGRTKILFTGEIGAGKTTFIQAFCRFQGVKERVTSPTFSLIN